MPSDLTLSIAREAAEGLAGDGAEAVVLVGSHARGDAGPESDVDLLAVGPQAFSFRLERRGGSLVSVSSRQLGSYRRELADPGSVCAAVPGWREAVPVHDPLGIAASLIGEAKAWTWKPLAERCDGWVAEEITSFAEEVHKLVSALRRGNRTAAAVQRSLLATRLAPILAVHRRILYGSENALWDTVGSEMGEEWRRAQSSSLGLDGEPFEQTCRAALELYGLAVDDAGYLFDERQKRVVSHALELAGLADDWKQIAENSSRRAACIRDEPGSSKGFEVFS
ncbi:hypothetical protein GBA63_00045 [Rubrobacter tropicus]|uniref:Polymerase nucleotidyl transferase domain-containing protein n=1 Tax=Rubrobacter tropicus TaxID=2653851 RepID=A0A6G8Q4E1_9ACTN|nr:nucleotidyltransferase domain-containing protein [Rubrobacter tropicus]QIN81187.1 hypothetical protein GBA63_00045 [Rubrobacter tropicus]